MTAHRRWAIVVVLGVAVAWWSRSPDDGPTSTTQSIARATAVLSDIADTDGEIRWTMSSRGVSVTSIHEESAAFFASDKKASIATNAWQIDIELARITEVRCVLRFVPGMMLTDVSFRGRDPDGHPAEILVVGFPEYRREQFDRLCAKHHLDRDVEGT